MVETSGDRGIVSRDAIRHQLLHGVDDLGAAAVVEADVQDAAGIGRCARLGGFDAVAHALRELVPPPAYEQPDATLVELVDLALDRLVEEAHQGADLGARPGPVLGRTGVHAEHLDAQVLAGVHNALHAPLPGPMAETVA